MAEPKKKEQERKTNDKVLNEEELKKVTGGVNQSGYEKNPANIGPHLAGFLHYSDYNLHSLLNEVIDEVLNDSQNNYNGGKQNEKRIYRTQNGNFFPYS